MNRAERSRIINARRPWQRVVFAADCDEDGNCPVCRIDYSDCLCPGPTMDDHEYRTDRDGVLWARKRAQREAPDPKVVPDADRQARRR